MTSNADSVATAGEGAYGAAADGAGDEGLEDGGAAAERSFEFVATGGNLGD